uniref:CXXC motif containing zinc binding protein n=1 Tax=Phallusia mammillata TaxID=59560 RepID=A0A6F9D9W7_9ASCI|nr:UPF0587 protein C1orf123 homolog [Phallusia mammillata]
MVKIALEIVATLENVSEIRTCGDDFRWFMKLRCNSCGEVSATWQYVCVAESTDTKGGRGSASMVQKCKMCSRENRLDIVEDKVGTYKADNDGQYVEILVLDCRGIEPVEFDFRSGWTVSSADSNLVFEDVDFAEKEWYDYDSNVNQSVSVTELEYRFTKIKK